METAIFNRIKTLTQMVIRHGQDFSILDIELVLAWENLQLRRTGVLAIELLLALENLQLRWAGC
jgi:hypothetical protein